MPSHMRDSNEPQTPRTPQPSAPQPTQPSPQPAQPSQTQQVPRPAGSRLSGEQPAPYANPPQEIDLPERSGPRLWWAWVILAAIVVVGVVWIWFFVIPHPEGSYEDVQGVTEEQVVEGGEGQAEGEGGEAVVPEEGSETGIGNQGTDTVITTDGNVWKSTASDLLTPIELNAVSGAGVHIVFLPDANYDQIDCRVMSVSVGDQTYDPNTEGSPVHIAMTAGPQGERDLTGDAGFSVGMNGPEGAYGARLLISVDGVEERGYNGMTITIDETPVGGETQTGTITISSEQSA